MIKIRIILFLILFNLLATASVFASNTDGTIDSTDRYAWGENVGFVDFGSSAGNVHITDSSLSGYAYGENIGWIDLSTITNNNEGTLSGYAWGENIGWVDFSGVSIGTGGVFSGNAYGENIGWITFGTSNNKVSTDWRPRSSRPSGGGGLPSIAFEKPEIPVTGLFVKINSNASTTSNKIVNLELNAGTDVKNMAISNFADFRFAGQEAYVPKKTWDICKGFSPCPNGEYTVYVKFYTSYGQSSDVVKDSILYKASSSNASINNPTVKYNLGVNNLKKGSTGEAVKELQRFLNTTLNLGLIVDGKLGPKTIEVIKKWQKANGLVPDGIVGPKTKKLINGV